MQIAVDAPNSTQQLPLMDVPWGGAREAAGQLHPRLHSDRAMAGRKGFLSRCWRKKKKKKK
jgi:hypothetical protein